VSYARLLFPDFALILCGFLLCRFTPLNRSIWQPVESLVYFFLFPVLLFHSIVKSPLDFAAASNLIASGLLLGASGIALAWGLPWWPWLGRHIEPRRHACAAQIAFRFNSFIALALSERLAGPEGMLLVAVLIGFCVPVFNVAAVWPMARGSERGFLRELARNPFIIATLLGLAGNLSGLVLPSWLEPAVARIGASSLPLGLMAAGAGLQLTRLMDARALAVALLSIRHLILPLVALGLCHGFRLAPHQAVVLMVFSALPTSSSAYLLATRMGYDGAYVAGLVTLSTLLGMFSLPFAIALLG
jgi:malonate transporter